MVGKFGLILGCFSKVFIHLSYRHRETNRNKDHPSTILLLKCLQQEAALRQELGTPCGSPMCVAETEPPEPSLLPPSM